MSTLIVDGKIVSPSIFSNNFHCAVDQCKGACCVQGDMGAPLEEDEVAILNDLLPTLRPRLSKEGRRAIDEHGPSVWYDELKEQGTTLREDEACAFVRIDEKGIANCTIEEAWQAGEIDFRKPVSCHLYPIRIEKEPQDIFETLDYEEWDICSPACKKGDEKKIKVYEFAREALIRKYGEPFYGALQAADPDPLKTNEPPFE